MAINPNNNSEENKREEKIQELRKVLNLDHFQIEIESLRQNIDLVKQQIFENTNILNMVVEKLNSVYQTNTPTSSQAAGSQLSALRDPQILAGLGTLFEGIGKAWGAYKGQSVPNNALDLQTMGQEFVGLIMKTSMDKLLMSTYDVRIPAPKSLINKIITQNEAHKLA